MEVDGKSQEMIFGWEAGLSCLKGWVRPPGTRILFVTGKTSFRKSGAEPFLRDNAGAGMAFRFSEFSSNPTYEDLLRGLAYFDAVKPDCMIAIGGGSVLDMAKLINFFGSTRQCPAGYLEQPRTVDGADLLPLIAIPTTAGTGSEATSFSVLYKDRIKYSVDQPGMLPSRVILIPELTYALSAYQSACSGFDALAQAIESYWAVSATEKSRQYSARAISLCMQYLEPAVLTPTPKSRVGMMKAAYLSGQAINIAKTTAAHAVSYTLTSFYGLPHGHAVAMMLPWVFELNASIKEGELNDPRGAEHVRMRVRELCERLECESSSAAVRMLYELTMRIGLSAQWISRQGFDVLDVRSRVARTVNMERLGNNPRALDAWDIEWIVGHIQ